MSIYKGLLFLDGFRVPAEYVEDVVSTPGAPVAKVATAPHADLRPPVGVPRWRRMLRGLAASAGLAGHGHSLGRSG